MQKNLGIKKISDGEKFRIYIELDTTELAVRLIESIMNQTRPAGMTAPQVLKKFYDDDPDLCRSFMVGAKIAMIYFVEQSEKSKLTH